MSTMTRTPDFAAWTTPTLSHHVSLADTVSQTMTMAWRATLKMRRNFEQFFDVTIQPLLFTAMFAYIFGGAVSGGVDDYLPILIPGLIAQTVLTACVATGVQLREDMDKGVFDRFRVLPIARIAPLAGPMVADMLRYAIAATLTFATGIAMGYRPGGGFPGVLRRDPAGDHRRLVAGLGVHLVRHRRQERPGRAGLLADGDVPADVPVQRVRPGRAPCRTGCRPSSSSTRSPTWSPRSASWPTTGQFTSRGRLGAAGLRAS